MCVCVRVKLDDVIVSLRPHMIKTENKIKLVGAKEQRILLLVVVDDARRRRGEVL